MPVRTPFALASLLLLLPAVAPAQSLDAEASAPYLWRVVVQVRPHPLLTPAFRDDLRRDLAAALQPAIGPLGTVEVIDLAELPRDRWDPLWQQFADTGFSALDAPRDLTGVKTHFLRVEYRGGQFHLESRQHDGFAGLSSPVVRKQAVRAPELVGRTAGLMIDRDFGAAGTIEPIAGKADEVRVRFRAGSLGPLDRIVKEGDVFAVARVVRSARPGATAPPVRTATGKIVAPPPGTEPPPAFSPDARNHAFTLLRVAEAPKDGAARCTVFTNLQNPFPAGASVAGYRCLKLATVREHVSVRLVDEGGKAATTPVAGVRANERGFGGQPEPRDFLDFKDGLYRSARPLSGLACVTVGLGATREARFPVPVLGSEPVTLRFAVDAKAEERAVFERAVLAASARTADARLAQGACFEAVAKLIREQKNKDALARAKAGAEVADATDKALSEEVHRLKEQAGTSPGSEALLAVVEKQLVALRETNALLAARVKDLEIVVAAENNPAADLKDLRAQQLNKEIGSLLAEGRVDEALVTYGELATLRPDDADVKARREKLAAEWKPKDGEHEKARDYLLKTWPALATLPDLKDSLPQLRTAVDVCKKAGDRYAFRRLAGLLGGFPAKLGDLVKDLDPNAANDLKSLQDARDIRDTVGMIEQEVVEFVKGGR